MEITFVRHAESVANLEGKWQGQSSSPLSKRGRDQARAVALRLAGTAYNLVLASDLERTMETARALERTVEQAPEWRELHVGAWEGLTQHQVSRQEHFARENLLLTQGRTDVRIGGGESWDMLRDRAVSAFEKVLGRLAPGDSALVVTHGGILATLCNELLGIHGVHPRPLGRLTNTALVRMRITDKGIEVHAYNDASHIAAAGANVGERRDAGNTILALAAQSTDEHRAILRAHHAEANWLTEASPSLESAGAWTDFAAQHTGKIVGIEVPPDHLALQATLVARVPPSARAHWAPPTPGGYAHVILSTNLASLADYNQTAHLGTRSTPVTP